MGMTRAVNHESARTFSFVRPLRIGENSCSFVVRRLRLAAVFAVACACSVRALTLSPDDEAARNVAFDWLGLVDAGNYKIAAAQMAEQVRATQRWVTYFSVNRAPRGKVKNREIISIKRTPTIKGVPVWWKFATVRFKTSFEGKPAALEEVVLTKASCCWDVSGYRIFSESDGHQGKSNEGNEFGHE